MTVIDTHTVHEVAAWRREGRGVWHFVFVVNGYDEDFVMREPGRLSEDFALQSARIGLAGALKVSAKHVIHKHTVKEP